MKATLIVAALVAAFAASPAPAHAQENQNIRVFASAARVGSVTPYSSGDIQNPNWKGGKFCVDITAEVGTATLDLKLQGKDNLSGTYFDIPGAALDQKDSITQDDCLTVYPGIAETSNESVSDLLPRIFRVIATVGTGGSSSFTFSVGASLTP